LNKVLQLQSELTYVQKGLKTNLESKTSTVYIEDRDYMLSFLEIPILLKATLGKGKTKFYPLVGVSVGYGLGGSMSYSLFSQPSGINHTSQYTKDYEIKFKENYDQVTDDYVYVGGPIDFGIQAGFGVFLFERLTLDLRYSHGLKGFEYVNNDSDKNRVLQFSIGVPLRLK
jgi:hypothetical protein